MGQDNSCGICGKYYQTCCHYVKEHVIKASGGVYCGNKGRLLKISISEFANTDIDPDDICKNCFKIANLTRFIP